MIGIFYKNISIFCHQGASGPIEVLNRYFEAFRGQIEIPHRSPKVLSRVESGLTDAFKSALEATVFILKPFKYLSIRSSICTII